MTEPDSAVMAGPATWGYCCDETCDQPAVYELEFDDWPPGVRSGCCVGHAPEVRRMDNLVRMWSVR